MTSTEAVLPNSRSRSYSDERRAFLAEDIERLKREGLKGGSGPSENPRLKLWRETKAYAESLHQNWESEMIWDKLWFKFYVKNAPGDNPKEVFRVASEEWRKDLKTNRLRRSALNSIASGSNPDYKKAYQIDEMGFEYHARRAEGKDEEEVLRATYDAWKKEKDDKEKAGLRTTPAATSQGGGRGGSRGSDYGPGDGGRGSPDRDKNGSGPDSWYDYLKNRKEYVQRPPKHIVAVFREGGYGAFEDVPGWEHVKFFSVTKKEERDKWCYLNMGAFNLGLIDSPGSYWKGMVDAWGQELNEAKEAVVRDPKKVDYNDLNNWTPKRGDEFVAFNDEIWETEKKLRRMMAISAPAWCMAMSGGSAATYVEKLSQQQGGNQSIQDEWREYLLHDDPDKYQRLISDPLVGHYYKKMLRDMKIEVEVETGQKVSVDIGSGRPNPHKGLVLAENDIENPDYGKRKKTKTVTQSVFKVDRGAATKPPHKGGSRLMAYVIDREDYGGGFSYYIDKELVNDPAEEAWIREQAGNGHDLNTLRSAARLAADAVLVDKWTRWVDQLNRVYMDEVRDKNPDNYDYSDPNGRLYRIGSLRLKPTAGWGGDPFSSVLQPSILPEKIKGVYTGGDRQVMRLLDLAFRPNDIIETMNRENQARYQRDKFAFNEDGEPPRDIDPIPVTAAVNFKTLNRYAEAHWKVLGGSLAENIRKWDPKILKEDLYTVAGKLFELWGRVGEEMPFRLTDGRIIERKQGLALCAAVMARIIETKTLATVLTSVKPTKLDNMTYILTRDPKVAASSGARPWGEVMAAIWGPDHNMHEGFLADLAGGEFRFKFDVPGDPYGIARSLNNSFNWLQTNDQTAIFTGGVNEVEIMRDVTQLGLAFVNVVVGKKVISGL